MAKQDLASYYTNRPSVGRLPLLPRRRGGEGVHTVFSLLGLLAGIGAGVFAYVETESIALPIFVFLMVNMFVARGLGDVVTDDHKLRRVVYFGLLPALCTGVLYLAYQWWELMWLAAIIGLFVGIVLWNLVVMLLFPAIHREELRDNEQRQDRAKAGVRGGTT
jgi:hypothetical protein